MNRKELVKKVRIEMFRIIEETGIEISKMSDEEFSLWVKKIVKQCSE